MSFDTLGLKPELLRAVIDKGYTAPTPIQLEAIPAVLSGRDVLAGAQTGTGKTAGFTLPLLQKLGERGARNPRALVLTPTRELAAQVAQSISDYGKYGNLRTHVVFGGVSEKPQIDKLRHGCDILVATPGRLLDLAQQGVASLGEVQVFVLDEADRMLDMGFIHDIKRVIRMLPQQRQNLMFSATYSDDIRDLAQRLLKNPQMIQVTPRNATADRVEQTAYRVPKEHKRHLLAHLINDGNWHQVLVFTRTKHGANRLAQQLERAGIRALAIHGNKSQNARVRALDDFKENRITALVATEVAARGLDIKELPHVVNYELPNVPEDYVHRIGRTARAGSAGAAVSLVSPDELSYLRDIEKLLKRQVTITPTPQFSIKESASAALDEPHAGAPREYQPHQDPRRRPEHRRPRAARGQPRNNDAGRAAHAANARAAGQPRGEPAQQRAAHSNRAGGGQRQHRGGGGGQGQKRGGGSTAGAGQGQRRDGGHGGRGGRGQQAGFARGARSAGGRGKGGPGGGQSGGFSRLS